MAAGFQAEEANTLCTTFGRLYVDFSGFFMGVQRALLYFLEAEFGVEPGVTAGVKAVHDLMEGRADTAYGLSEAWSVAQGTGQGCVLGPCRATMQLIVTMTAIVRFGSGYCFEVPRGADRACVRQSWFADDYNGPAHDAQGLQLNLEGADLGAWLSGNKIGVAGPNDPSKTGYSLETCQAKGGFEHEHAGFDIRLLSGQQTPQVTGSYRLLGSQVNAKIGNEASVVEIVYRASMTCRLLARLRGLRLDVYSGLCNAVLIGITLFYGGPTPVNFKEAEKIDLVVRKAIRRLGHQAPAGPRVQLYARRSEGGLAHIHAYAHAGAASVVHLDKGLRAAPGDAHGVSSQAAIRLRAHQLGFVPEVGANTPLDWLPDYAVLQLQPERATDAFWLALIRARLMTRHSGSRATPGSPRWTLTESLTNHSVTAVARSSGD
jgi:hypothetical protein